MELLPRKDITTLLENMMTLPPVDCPINHYFAPGIYVREMIIPAHSFVVGHHHKHEHICSLIQGVIAFATESGHEIRQAPYTFRAAPGCKAVFSLTDCVVINIHPNPDNLTDEADLEKLYIEKIDIPKLEEI